MSRIDVVVTGPEWTFGVGAVQQDGDRVVGSMPTGPWFADPGGQAALGSLGVLLDDVLGYSLIASMEQDSWSVSTEIWVDLMAPLPGDGSRLHAEARTLEPGSFAAGSLVGADGRLLATCRQRGRRVEEQPDPSQSDGEHRSRAAAVDGMGGLVATLGLEEYDDRLSLPVRREHENPRRMLHGGVSLAASEAAASWSRRAAGCELPSRSLHIAHLRPIPSGATFELRCTTLHAGRTLWLTDVVGTVDGKVCTTTRVTALAHTGGGPS